MIRSTNGGARRQRFAGPWNQNPWFFPHNVGPRAHDQQQEPIGLTLHAPEPSLIEPGHMSQLNAAHANNLRKSRQLQRTLSVWEDETSPDVELERPPSHDSDDPGLISEVSLIREDDR